MDSVIIAVSILVFAALAYLCIRLSTQRNLILQLHAEQRALAAILRQEHADLTHFIQSQPGPIITIEILNAVEVASQSSILAGLAGKLAPDTIQRVVVKRTADMMRAQMAEHGVDVQVLVHDPD